MSAQPGPGPLLLDPWLWPAVAGCALAGAAVGAVALGLMGVGPALVLGLVAAGFRRREALEGGAMDFSAAAAEARGYGFEKWMFRVDGTVVLERVP